MKLRASVIGALAAALAATGAAAQVQGVNLTGQYKCVSACAGNGDAFITQYGWQLNVTSDAGIPSRAWVDYPGRIWVEQANQGAMYSLDGNTIQFDRGTIWQRIPELPPPPPPRRRK
ncbi:MAG: hypothetical protein WDO17_21315 [Alphaproteobacteria bacterium]